VVTRFLTDIKSSRVWYTDSNGREMQYRKKNYRPSWPLEVYEWVAGNYYPVTTMAYISDHNAQLTVLTDRSQGCTSLRNGELEFMVHRRLLYDDGRGVGEPLNETAGITPYPRAIRLGPGMPITGTHRLMLQRVTDAMKFARPMAKRVYQPLTLAFAPMPTGGSVAVNNWLTTHVAQRTEVATDLPINVDVLTLQQWPDDGARVLRLEHQFAVGEDKVFSQPVTVSLSTLFLRFNITSLTELSLTANQPLSSVSHLAWITEDDDTVPKPRRNRRPFQHSDLSTDFNITLNPMQIRTFQLSTQVI